MSRYPLLDRCSEARAVGLNAARGVNSALSVANIHTRPKATGETDLPYRPVAAES